MKYRYGGVIILGVCENEDGSWNTTGLSNEAKLRKDFWDTINNVTKVSANLLADDDVKTYTIGSDAIMVITVPPAGREQKPVYINNDIFRGTFRRNWEGDYHCTPSEVRAMLRDQTEQTMDMKVLENWSLEDLNQETIQAYRNMHRSWKPGHVWGMLENTEYLRNIGAAARSKEDGQLHPTAAGMLMNIILFGNFQNIFLIIEKLLIQQSDGRTACSQVPGNGLGMYLIFTSESIIRLQKTLRLLSSWWAEKG